MQHISTICDICYDEGTAGSIGETVDLSWLRPGYEVDICERHLAELEGERTRLAHHWLKSARRSVIARNGRSPVGSTGTTAVPGYGIEGVDWRWSKGGTRRQKIVNEVCPEPGCGRAFSTKASYSQHIRTHDPETRERLLTQLGQS